MENQFDDELKLLEERREQLERALTRVTNAIAALRSNDQIETTIKSVKPAIVDIVVFLRHKDKPVHQNEIISTIGEMRQKRYPSLSNHYSTVWRALEYHIRHDRVIDCVSQQGRKVKLKPLPHRPKSQRVFNSPALYEQDNWFVLKEHDTEQQIAEPMKHSNAPSH